MKGSISHNTRVRLQVIWEQGGDKAATCLMLIWTYLPDSHLKNTIPKQQVFSYITRAPGS